MGLKLYPMTDSPMVHRLRWGKCLAHEGHRVFGQKVSLVVDLWVW